jgi:hypothetical protein
MLDSIIALLGIEFNTSTEKVDIAKGQYKLPETNKELLKTLKTIKKEWKSLRSK